MSTRAIFQRGRRAIALSIVLLLAIFLLFPNLVNWPVSWYDEGINLQVPKNLVLQGLYGLQSTEGFRLFDPIVTTGPTVMVPIALIFKIFEIDIYYARLIMVLYALLTITIFFLIAAYIFDLKVAVIASFFLLVTPPITGDDSASFLGLGRMVMGEIPALFFLLLGSLIWFKALDGKKRTLLIVSGIAFGLAMITKELDLFLVPALILVFLIDRLWHRQLVWSQIVIPIVVGSSTFLLWKGYQLSLLGLDNQLVMESSVDRFQFLAIPALESPSLLLQNVKALFAAGVLTWGLPGLIYGFYVSIKKDLTGLQRTFLLIIAIIWLAWFVAGSIGWLRYALTAMAILNIYVVKLLVDLANSFEISLADLRPTVVNREKMIRAARILAVSIAIFFTFLMPLRQWTKQMSSGGERAQFLMASYLDDNVADGRIIETSELEHIFLSNRSFHQPTIDIQNLNMAFASLGRPYPEDFYDFSRFDPDYVLRGPYAKQSELYLEVYDSSQYELEVTYGPYDLYRVINQSEK